MDAEPDYQIVWDAARGMLPLSVRQLPTLARERQLTSAFAEYPPVVAAELRKAESVPLRAGVGKVLKMWDRVLKEHSLKVQPF